MQAGLTVGAVARRAGVRASTMRYYEVRGVLPPAERRPNGYRVYPPDAVAWLRFIQRAQAFGMTLEEIRQLLELAGRGEQPCGRVRELARQRLRDVEARIEELALLRGQLRTLLRRRSRGGGSFCPLIEPDRERPRASPREDPSAAGRRRPMAAIG